MPADAMDYEKVNQALVSKDTNALKGILLENGIDINATFDGGPQFGKTALHLCCEGSLTESAQLLIQHGASVNVVDKWNQTPLMYGVCANSPAIVNLLLESRCELNHTDR
jgi:ankyrin repeat protein